MGQYPTPRNFSIFSRGARPVKYAGSPFASEAGVAGWTCTTIHGQQPIDKQSKEHLNSHKMETKRPLHKTTTVGCTSKEIAKPLRRT